ncbi:MAG: class I SAM-dependent methyltransferase [Anaerolineales bacterium]|nr:class I SAM-dependent methyltransferase [Anaerolineales bacterium]
MTNDSLKTQSSYNKVAAEYAERFKDEMDDKPFDRERLDRLTLQAGALGPICDLGCGSGQIARYLHRKGVDTLGVDLSPQMISVAKNLNPGIEFRTGDMLALPKPDNCWGGIAAFYCIIHFPHTQVVQALKEMHRKLIPGGTLLLAFHTGNEVLHLDEWWEKPVNLDFIYFQVKDMESWLLEAGFEITESITRQPDPNIESETVRAYLFAKKRRNNRAAYY